MANEITVTSQAMKVEDVEQVIITDKVEDEENQIWVREVRVFGVAPVGQARPLIFTLRLEAAEEQFIDLQAPAQTF